MYEIVIDPGHPNIEPHLIWNERINCLMMNRLIFETLMGTEINLNNPIYDIYIKSKTTGEKRRFYFKERSELGYVFTDASDKIFFIITFLKHDDKEDAMIVFE